MAKNLSAIGNIMELLNVSVQQLARYLYIDRTTISKWRTGSRKLSERSPYYDELVRYFVTQNKNLGNNPLKRLFSDIYPDTLCDSDEQTAELVKRYLQDSKTSAIVGQIVEDMHKALYHANVSVFRGAEGRKNAISMILNMAESSPIPCHIKIFELDQFEWLNRDMAYVQTFLAKMDLLTKRGHSFELTYSAGKTSLAFEAFVRALTGLIFNKNVKINLFQPSGQVWIMPSLYGIEGKCVAVGVNNEPNMDNMHTVVHFDEFTTSKYLQLHDRMVQLHTQPYLVTDDPEDKDRILELMQYTKTKKEPSYFYGRFIPIATMSEGLLQEILDANHLSQAEKQRALSLHQTLHDALLNSPEDSRGGLFLNMGAISESLGFDSLIQYELSAFAQRPVVMSKAQHMQHLAETAAFFAQHPEVRVSAVQGRNTAYETMTAGTWIKRNFWTITLNEQSIPEQNKVIFFDDVALVNLSAKLCEEAQAQYPLKYKDPEYIQSMLQRMSRGEGV